MRRLVHLVFLGIFVLSGAVFAQVRDGVVRGSYINVRSDKSFNASVVGKKLRGSPYSVTYEEGGWLKVQFSDGVSGWIYETITEKKLAAIEAEEKKKKKPKAVATSTAQLPTMTKLPKLPASQEPGAGKEDPAKPASDKTEDTRKTETPSPAKTEGTSDLAPGSKAGALKKPETPDKSDSGEKTEKSEKGTKADQADKTAKTAKTPEEVAAEKAKTKEDKKKAEIAKKELAKQEREEKKKRQREEKEAKAAAKKKSDEERRQAAADKKATKEKGTEGAAANADPGAKSTGVEDGTPGPKGAAFSKSPEEYYNQAIELYEKKKYPEALEANKSALKQAPNNAEIMNNLGNCYFKLGKVDDALKHWKDGLALSPKSAKICNNIGIAYYQIDENEKAIEFYRKAVLFEPDFPDPYYNLASVYGFKNNFSEALKYYKKYTEFAIDPTMKQLTEERIEYCQKQLVGKEAAGKDSSRGTAKKKKNR
jgi:tetratricopeptide (TPR) repeat protein